jgi:hypothetical protein
MKNIAIIGSLVLSSTAFAHDSNFNINSENCAVSFQNDVRISNNLLTIENKTNQQLKITSAGQLYLDGNEVALNANQQYAITQYQSALRQELPKVADIALDAVKIAGVALEEVGNAFGLSSLDDMNDLMDELSVEVKDTFYRQGDFVMGEKSFNEFDTTLENKFEARMEEAIKSSMMESIGSLLVTIGSEMLSSGGDMNEFEARMEKMGQNIEEKVELQAKGIEERADKLCEDFTKLATMESELAETIPQLSDYKLFTIKNTI